ncbi:hypothetical protein IV203_018664 [Nitzschia inconspicua]|uniref:Uncharacterized protein n=1 Tax=Nitzschia inconspicua TaxID=303405 RepID=A0A9K3Q6K1_9STRA|nr:hypothetical protein IV203_018664 [Nitzschia inconspicua]
MVTRKSYNIEHVKKGNDMTVMEEEEEEEHHVENAAGMTQGMDNCSADISFVSPGDDTSDTTNPASSYELLNPLLMQRAHTTM